MYKTLLLIMLFIFNFSNILICQNKEEADKLIKEGIPYYEKGDYEGAIYYYDKALQVDKDNLLALAEKVACLLPLKKYEETINYCKRVIELYPKHNDLKSVYVNYGNALDELNKTDKAIEIYNEGLNIFPNYYSLHYNKGITFRSVKKYDSAMKCFQFAVINNPDYASGHNAIANHKITNNSRIQKILAFCRYLTIDATSKRAKSNIEDIMNLLRSNVSKNDYKSLNITINSNSLTDTNLNNKTKENDFEVIDILFSMNTALEILEKKDTLAERAIFANRLDKLFQFLRENKKDNYGFFWDYYAPFFIEMREKKFIETFSYIAFASKEDENIINWLKSHRNEVKKFFDWTYEYNWKLE